MHIQKLCEDSDVRCVQKKKYMEQSIVMLILRN